VVVPAKLERGREAERQRGREAKEAKKVQRERMDRKADPSLRPAPAQDAGNAKARGTSFPSFVRAGRMTALGGFLSAEL
jgi:hypothetical protein